MNENDFLEIRGKTSNTTPWMWHQYDSLATYQGHRVIDGTNK